MIDEKLWHLIRSALFRIDAERAHAVAARAMRVVGPGMLRFLSGAPSLPAASAGAEVFGLRFANRVGLAAGFDKNAELLSAWPALGFGFVEIGTVTPRAQPGNDRPRLFRDPSRGALFNRMGFNNAGAPAAARRLAEARPHLPEGFRVGANVGKNKDTALDEAWRDYRDASRAFRDLADYLVVNVSSPNTPGLRALQTVEALRPIVQETLQEAAAWRKAPPVLLKLAPELDGDALGEVLREAEVWGVAGWVLTNTLAGRGPVAAGELAGGWSGPPVREASRASLRLARERTRLPIISVGGIDSVEEARRRRAEGASLVQLYTGFVYEGPSFPTKIAAALAAGA